MNQAPANKALVTLACGYFFEQLGTVTHPTLAAYAQKIGADFVVWRDFAGHALPHYKKLDLGELLARYDRVLYVDTDVVIRDDAPDLFELVPADALGILDESPYFDRGPAMRAYLASCGFPPEQWDGRYYNTGVMVLSPAHRSLFVRPAVESDHFKEQSYLNLRIAQTKTKTFPLPYRFNRQLGLDAVYGEDRLDSYLLHYAGLTIDDSELAGRMQIIAMDLERWRRSRQPTATSGISCSWSKAAARSNGRPSRKFAMPSRFYIPTTT